MSRFRLALLLAPAGLFGGHALLRLVGPWLDVEPHAHGQAGPTPVFAGIVLLLSLTALGFLGSRVLPRGRAWPVLLSQLVLFGVVELAERHSLAAVIENALHDPRWWMAVACQVVATCVVLLLAQAGLHVHDALGRLLSRMVWIVPAAPSRLDVGCTPWSGSVAVQFGRMADPRRGPPAGALLTV